MMNIDIENTKLEAKDKAEIERLLKLQNPHIDDDLEQIWYLIDKVWDSMGCDNKHLNWENIGRFYAHPIWVLNGLFIEQHELSMNIRENIAKYIATKNYSHICDYGGGFGTLAREIAIASPNAQIDIYEPFPSQYGKLRIQDFPNVKFVDTLESCKYDCIVSTDVLEHVDSPLEDFAKLLRALKIGGNALIGNCFYPVIKCHLPKNFHFRYSFHLFARAMGLRKQGVVSGAKYVEIFTKINNKKPNKAIMAMGGGCSRLFYLIICCLEPLRPIARYVKRKIKTK